MKEQSFYVRLTSGLYLVQGWTDGTFNYHLDKLKNWYAIDPASSLSVAKGRSRKEVFDMTRSLAIQTRIAKTKASQWYAQRVNEFTQMKKEAQL